MMFAIGAQGRWSWREDAAAPVAFCVRALVHDGLAVSPFDRHRGGDGSLRAAGLDAGAWREWLRAIPVDFDRVETMAQNRAVGEHPPAFADVARVADPLFLSPGSLCGGSARSRPVRRCGVHLGAACVGRA